MELFGLTDHDVFICRSAVINGNLAECYFSEAWLKSGQAPVKLGAGNRVLISQSVGVGRINCGPCWVIALCVMGLTGHGSNLQMAHF